MMKALEIRVHGRGGQGGVTCAKILASFYARIGKSVQTFGDYAGERSGAPVRAFTRVSDHAITNRNKVYEPDQILVLDPTLLSEEVLTGLVPGGSLLLNVAEGQEALQERFHGFQLGLVDATAIARKHGIGTKSLVIVNTTIAGAYAKMAGLPFSLVEDTYRDLGFASNLEAAKEAYSSVDIQDSGGGLVSEGRSKEKDAPQEKNKESIQSLPSHQESPPTPLKTGSWKTQQPVYTENLAPCSAWCPAGNDVIGFIQASGKEDATQATSILAATTPFPGVCGRVCPAPCMEGCNRRELDGSVHIRGLERWIADQKLDFVPLKNTPSKIRSIGILGSGPAGISAAYQLALKGHQVRIYEGEPELGGVLRTGIPSYRLPRSVLDREIGKVLALGVEAQTGTFLNVSQIEELAEKHEALILATGLQKLRALEVEGKDLIGIEQGIHFLHGVNLEGGRDLQGHVVVLGGGNTAMDCARSALRSGADRVTIAYRRTRVEMPAIGEEILEAEEEGVEILFQRQPLSFVGRNKVEGIQLAEVEMGEPDDSGRRKPVVTDRVETLACDHVLLALGQSKDTSLLPQKWEIREDRIWKDDSRLPVFLAGDFSTGEGTVTHAIGNGRRVAGQVLGFLGEEVEVFERPDRKTAVPATDIRFDHFERSEPARLPALDPKKRIGSFEEVNQGLPQSLEAHRCFSCGHCTSCDTCLVYCPEGIIRRKDLNYEVDYSYCKGCGICVEECPREAMEMTR
jgi:2-oxoacid:acceptor oxidoreductase gamma subunit (pyruvate/2-ketoisovalerate family)/2-oxoacid:acceptor oxidoreductase delta subunit (pyruvate/2-ketoisovalerate family)